MLYRYFSTAKSQKSRQEEITDIQPMFKEVLLEGLKNGPPFERYVLLVSLLVVWLYVGVLVFVCLL